MARDVQRSKVYAAEQFVRIMFDRAAEHHSRAIDFFGTALTLPPEARFASVESVQRYVDEVLAMPAVTERSSRWALQELVLFFGHSAGVDMDPAAQGSSRPIRTSGEPAYRYPTR